MAPRLREGLSFVRTVAREASDREITFLAASLAYYAFVSLVPSLVLAVLVASYVGGEALAAEVTALAGRYLLPAGRLLVERALANATGSRGLTVAGLILAVWGSLKLFRSLDVAFSRVYGSDPGGLIERLKAGAVALVAVGVGVFGTVVVGAFVALFELPYADLVGSLLLLATLAVAFFPLYYVFPDVEVGVVEVLPGTVFAALGWTVFSALFTAYAAYALERGTFALYGVFGAILMLVTWFYVGGLVLLLGALGNAVLAGRISDRQVQHDRRGHDTQRL